MKGIFDTLFPGFSNFEDLPPSNQELLNLAARYRMAKDPESQLTAAILEAIAEMDSIEELAICLGKIKD